MEGINASKRENLKSLGSNPIKGLLLFYYYGVSGTIVLCMALSLMMVTVAIITGNDIIYGVSILLSVAGLPYTIIVSMCQKSYLKWERFRLTMPIKRRELASVQYLCVLLASLVGFPLAVLIVVVTPKIHGTSGIEMDLFYILSILALPLLYAGLLFTIGCTKIGEKYGEVVFMLCLMVAVGVNMVLIPRIGDWLNWSWSITSLVVFAVGVVVFIISWRATGSMYEKKDF